MTQTSAPPVSRIGEIDAIRGFALGGILLANIGFFADPVQLSWPEASTIYTGPVRSVVDALVLSKFYVIFSFLFGYSFTLQMRSAGGAGASVGARTLRRCLGLFLIGALHGLLLWSGDILTLYAALGLVLLAMRRVRPRTAITVSGVILMMTAALLALLSWLSTLVPAGAIPAPAAGDPARLLAEINAGPLDYLSAHVPQYLLTVPVIWLVQGPVAMAMFLLGLAAGRTRLFEERDRWAHLMPRVQWLGFGVGAPFAVLTGASHDLGQSAELLVHAGNAVASPLLAAAYVVTLLRLAGRFPALPAVLAPAGRLAASNYVGQSVLACLVFTGYGLGLAGRIPPLGTVAVALLIYAVLLALSAWWLRSHRYGPVEYGLRRLTLWR
ncbi:membrane protein [Microtetraspora sp. NBRC 13810]|uniref:DUF418 domain-containing protein n=1 Tax=Microtetraspora sp. NBRC 13810 TaxID=3030990 RepID=UPI0024A2A21B|nr:DUF418 domain-containing protein [Microtetraspora sp. NBRC 13810]GLW09200.1 membrane protein [Microtetraspora sp. NBRC 13810]